MYEHGANDKPINLPHEALVVFAVWPLTLPCCAVRVWQQRGGTDVAGVTLHFPPQTTAAKLEANEKVENHCLKSVCVQEIEIEAEYRAAAGWWQNP